MAKSGNFTYTNTTTSLVKSLPLYDTDEMSNYGRTTVTGKTTYLNSASDTDAAEKFALFASNVKNVPSSCEVYNPSRRRVAAQDNNQGIQEGVMYGVYTDAIHREVDSADASYVVDRPVRVKLEIVHENAATITDAQLKELIGRTVSHLFDESNASRLTLLRGKVTEISAD